MCFKKLRIFDTRPKWWFGKIGYNDLSMTQNHAGQVQTLPDPTFRDKRWLQCHILRRWLFTKRDLYGIKSTSDDMIQPINEWLLHELDQQTQWTCDICSTNNFTIVSKASNTTIIMLSCKNSTTINLQPHLSTYVVRVQMLTADDFEVNFWGHPKHIAQTIGCECPPSVWDSVLHFNWGQLVRYSSLERICRDFFTTSSQTQIHQRHQ